MASSRSSFRDASAARRFPGSKEGDGSEAGDVGVGQPEKETPGRIKKKKKKSCWSCCCRRQSGSHQDAAELNALVTGRRPSPPITDLVVRSVDLLSSKRGENRTEHHTDQYHGDELITRRGQTFQIVLELSRPLNVTTDKLHLELKTGPLPTVSRGTHVVVPLVEELEDLCWEAKAVEQKGNRVKLSVNSPADAVIGRFKLAVITGGAGGESRAAHDPGKGIIMLFNPWCEEDAVYMDDEEEREEYVLNDTGKIYYGTEKQIGGRAWNFGQFQEEILDACLYVLEKSGVPPSGFADPVNVVRVISAMVNSPNDSGVLMGNWSGKYQGGTSPTAWSGSVEILRRYHRSGGTPVRYGQCWVFSGVTTTVLRCLGIPTRSVTNFQSAHDTDVSLTTDVYFDENMEPINSMNSDSVWNFHVWNDCWMSRPDLPPGMGGWQAVDATPQETSQGIYRCGPASLMAIRTGQVYLKHDTPFIFAEVNSDKIYWQRGSDGTFSIVRTEKNTVGRCISTKAVGSDLRADVTHMYKHPEGSEEERIAVETACRYGTKPNVYQQVRVEDVTAEAIVEGEGPAMGADAQLKVVVKNRSSEPRHATLHTQAAVVYYTGVFKTAVKSQKLSVHLKPNEKRIIDWVLPYRDYQDQLVDQASLMLTLSGRVTETNQVLASQTSFRLRCPDIHIVPLGETYVGKEGSAELTFTNPLPCVLQDVVLVVEGLGLRNLHPITLGDVGKHATVSVTEHFIPTAAGKRKLVASLDCKQLTHVHGAADVIVHESQ